MTVRTMEADKAKVQPCSGLGYGLTASASKGSKRKSISGIISCVQEPLHPRPSAGVQ